MKGTVIGTSCSGMGLGGGGKGWSSDFVTEPDAQFTGIADQGLALPHAFEMSTCLQDVLR